MARFTFKLDGVLRQRKHVERQRQRQVAVAQAELTTLESELRAVEGMQAAATTDLRDNRLVGRIDLSFLAAHRRFMIATQRKGMAVVQKIAVAQQKVDTARTALADAAKGRKAIETLREKRFDEWRRDEEKKEADLLDEVGMQLSYFHSKDDKALANGTLMP